MHRVPAIARDVICLHGTCIDMETSSWPGIYTDLIHFFFSIFILRFIPPFLRFPRLGYSVVLFFHLHFLPFNEFLLQRVFVFVYLSLRTSISYLMTTFRFVNVRVFFFIFRSAFPCFSSLLLFSVLPLPSFSFFFLLFSPYFFFFFSGYSSISFSYALSRFSRVFFVQWDVGVLVTWLTYAHLVSHEGIDVIVRQLINPIRVTSLGSQFPHVYITANVMLLWTELQEIQ